MRTIFYVLLSVIFVSTSIFVWMWRSIQREKDKKMRMKMRMYPAFFLRNGETLENLLTRNECVTLDKVSQNTYSIIITETPSIGGKYGKKVIGDLYLVDPEVPMYNSVGMFGGIIRAGSHIDHTVRNTFFGTYGTTYWCTSRRIYYATNMHGVDVDKIVVKRYSVKKENNISSQRCWRDIGFVYISNSFLVVSTRKRSLPTLILIAGMIMIENM